MRRKPIREEIKVDEIVELTDDLHKRAVCGRGINLEPGRQNRIVRWKTRCGGSIAIWSFGELRVVFDAEHNNQGCVDAEDSMCGWRRAATHAERSQINKRWIYGDINSGPETLQFADRPPDRQLRYDWPLHPVETLLLGDCKFLEFVKDDACANLAYFRVSEGIVQRGGGVNEALFGYSNAAGLLVRARDFGECYSDFKGYHGASPTASDEDVHAWGEILAKLELQHLVWPG